MKICVVGCERSGTSAVSILLSIGSGWSLLDDPPESWRIYPKIYRKGRGLTLQLWWKLRRHKIVKVPGFATILPYLRRRFVGNFTTLYCVRDPRDVVASIMERLEHGYTPLFTDVAWLGIHMTDSVESLAWRWRRYLECALAYQRQGGKIIFIKYEDFCANKARILMECAIKLRVPFDLAKVRPFLDEQFRKGWADTIRGPGRWQKDLSEADVRKITSICGELMKVWGYKDLDT